MQLDLGQKMKLLNEIFTDGYHVKRRLLGATLSSNKNRVRVGLCQRGYEEIGMSQQDVNV